MLKGSIYIVNDMNTAMECSLTHTIICVSGETHNYPDFIQATNANIASILLPSYEAMMMEMDGNIEGFKLAYYTHLSQNESFTFMSIILRALYNGRNIIFYLTKEESEMLYIKALAQYFFDYFGITIGTPNNPFFYNNIYDPVILKILFSRDLMSGMEFLALLPETSIISDPTTIIKLVHELNPYVPGNDLENYARYFMNFSKKLKLNSEIIIPFGGIVDANNR